jgi:hypothetical protein
MSTSARRGACAVAVAATAILGLTACSGSTGSGEAATGPAAGAPSTGASTTSNIRGVVTKQVGQPFVFYNRGHKLARITVTDVDTQATCQGSETGAQPKNGHWLGVSVRIATAKDVNQTVLYNVFNPNDLKIVTPGGATTSTVRTAALATCDNATTSLPTTYRPGMSYTGFVLLDSPSEHGRLIYQPAGRNNGAAYDF